MIKRLSLPLQLILIIIFVIAGGSFIPENIVRGCYTFSMLFKELLNLFLPAMVFSFVFAGIIGFKKSAPLVLTVMLSMITLSNTLTALITYGIANITLPFICNNQAGACLLNNDIKITPFFTFSLPCPISSEKALLLALGLGLLLNFFSMPLLEKALLQLKDIIKNILNNYFIPFIPLYVLGFLLKIHYEGVFGQLITYYGKIFLLIILIQIIYLTLLYFVANKFSFTKTKKSIRNAVPSYLTGFSTMSSTATIPVTLEGVEKNIGKSAFALLAVPITANVHLLGDCISTPLLALVTMKLFFGTIPSLINYLTFLGYFSTSMLAAAGVPGGGILVIIPILKSILGFTPEMISIITTLYLLQDPIGTAGNVMGDGALIIMMNNTLKKFKIIK